MARFLAAAVLAAGIFAGGAEGGAPSPGRRELSWRDRTRRRLDRRVSFDFADTTIDEALELFARVTRVEVKLDPQIPANRAGAKISLRLSDISAETALAWAVELAGLDYRLAGGGVLVSTPERIGKRWRGPPPEPDWGVAVRRRLAKPVTFGPERMTLAAALERLGRAARLNIIADPGVRAEGVLVPVGAGGGEGESGRELLDRILRARGLEWVALDGAVFVTTPVAAAALCGRGAGGAGGAGAAVREPEWAARLRRALDEKIVSFDVRGTPFPRVIELLARESGLPIVLDPGAKASEEADWLDEITHSVDQKSAALALDEVAARVGYGYTMHGGRVLVSTPARIGEIRQERFGRERWRREIRCRLDRRVSFEFDETPFGEAVAFLRTLTNVNFVFDPALERRGVTSSGGVRLSLKAADMSAADALTWMTRLAGADYTFRNGAVFIASPARIRMGPAAAAHLDADGASQGAGVSRR